MKGECKEMTEQEARTVLEGIRWPRGPECVQCGSKNVTHIHAKASGNHPERRGLYSCRKCRRQFTVTIGTVFQGTHLPLNKIVSLVQKLPEFFDYGKSLRQISNELGLRYKAAHRIVSEMKERDLKTLPDIMDMAISLSSLKDNVKFLLWDQPEDTEEFRAGLLIMLKMTWGIPTPQKLAQISGYDPEFVSKVFQNCEQNHLWGKNRIYEEDDWTNLETWDKNKNMACVSFMLHVLCALGEIRRSFNQTDPLYELEKAK